WTADRHGDLCRLGEHMERVGMDCRRRPIPCLPPRVASRCMEPGHLDLNGSRRHLANGFTTPRIGANQFLRRTVNAQTNPWQNISIASAISSSRTRRISGSVGSWPRVRMIVLLSLRTRLGWRGCLTG
ncbi:tetracycline resistance protein, class C, partial [Fusobacterium animalis D11]